MEQENVIKPLRCDHGQLRWCRIMRTRRHLPLPQNKERFGNACNFGLYRDDGLGVTKASPWQAELIKKEMCSIFAKYGLKVTIEANKKVVTVSYTHLTLPTKRIV